MEKRLFFLREDGWFEAGLTRRLMLASHEELVRWACIAMDRSGYRNYMITENPRYTMKGGSRTVLLHEDVMDPAHETSVIIPAGRHAS